MNQNTQVVNIDQLPDAAVSPDLPQVFKKGRRPGAGRKKEPPYRTRNYSIPKAHYEIINEAVLAMIKISKAKLKAPKPTQQI